MKIDKILREQVQNQIHRFQRCLRKKLRIKVSVRLLRISRSQWCSCQQRRRIINSIQKHQVQHKTKYLHRNSLTNGNSSNWTISQWIKTIYTLSSLIDRRVSKHHHALVMLKIAKFSMIISKNKSQIMILDWLMELIPTVFSSTIKWTSDKLRNRSCTHTMWSHRILICSNLREELSQRRPPSQMENKCSVAIKTRAFRGRRVIWQKCRRSQLIKKYTMISVISSRGEIPQTSSVNMSLW